MGYLDSFFWPCRVFLMIIYNFNFFYNIIHPNSGIQNALSVSLTEEYDPLQKESWMWH